MQFICFINKSTRYYRKIGYPQMFDIVLKYYCSSSDHSIFIKEERKIFKRFDRYR